MLLDPRDARPRAARRGGARAPRGRRALQARAAGGAARDRARRRRARSARRRGALAQARARPGRRGRRHRAARRRRACIPFAAAEGELNDGRALRRAAARVRAGRAPPARLRAAGPRRGRRRRPHARGLQRAALLPARAGGARRQRALLRRPRQRPRLGAPAAVRAAAAPGRAAGAWRRWEGSRRRWLGRGGGRDGRSPRSGGGSCARIPAFGTLEVRVPDAQSDGRRRRRAWPRSCTRSSPGWPSATTPARRWRPRRRGGSRRTAGRRAATGSTASWPTSITGERAPDARAAAAALLERARGARPSASAAPAELGRARAARGANGALRQRARRRATGRRGQRRGSMAGGALSRVARRRHVSCSPMPAATLSAAAPRAPRGSRPRAARAARRRSTSPTRWATTTCSSRSTSATSCTTAALPGVDERWEWEPVAARASARVLGARFEAALLAAIGRAARRPRPARSDGPRPARRSLDADDGPVAVALPRARGIAGAAARVRRAPLGLPAQGGRPALVGASPRLCGAAEGGAGRDPGRRVRRRAPRAHPRELFAATMEALGLDRALRRLPRPPPGRHARDREPDVAASGCTGACAARSSATSRLFEMTSSLPNRRYANGLRRLGFGAAATDFFDEHVEADAVHENVAAVDLAGGLARAEPALGRRHPLGRPRARRARGAAGREHLLDAWEARRSLAAARGARARGLAGADDAASSAPLGGAEARSSLCVPSQNGRIRDLPQRHSATVRRPARSRCRPGRRARTARARAAGRRGRA